MKTHLDGSGEIDRQFGTSHRCTIKGGSIWPRLRDSDGSGPMDLEFAEVVTRELSCQDCHFHTYILAVCSDME